MMNTITKNLVQNRLAKTDKIGKIICQLPFVRCVILNGSLASGTHKQESDIDILIIAKDGHVFTARFFVNLLATIFRIKRSKNDSKGHAGKFCFNYFLTESYLTINYPKEREEYCAHNYSKSRFVAGDIKCYEMFMTTNDRLFKKHNCHPERSEGSISSKILQSPRRPQNDKKKLLKYFFVDWFEKWAKNYQIKKIESDPRTKKYPDHIVYNNKELRFHPSKKTRLPD